MMAPAGTDAGADGAVRHALDRILDHVRGEPSRTWSIIITLYGDAIVPRGGCVWLGTLLPFFRAMGVADGVVRTAMSRLAADGWLERRRVGRKSFYCLAPRGERDFREAAERIYRPRDARWSGEFELVLPELEADRERLRPAFAGAGFGAPAPGLWLAPLVRPPADRDASGLDTLLGSALRLRARADLETARALAARSWPLPALGEAYARFAATFAPLEAALAAGHGIGDLDALVARVLLIHAYRRIVLRDPGLPPELLPEGWAGGRARELCAALYPRLLPTSEDWLDANAVDESGAALPQASCLAERFRP